mgnify:CR=1 FL=1
MPGTCHVQVCCHVLLGLSPPLIISHLQIARRLWPDHDIWQAAEWFATAPLGATQKALAKAGWAVGDVQLWEINEAFAVVTLAAMKELSLPHERVNVHGGACALGHPIGASGARILVTLLGALLHHGLRRGVASLCIGGGEATAMAIELL